MDIVGENNLYIKISIFGNNNPGGFMYSDIIKKDSGVIENEWEKKIIEEYMINALESGFQNDYFNGPFKPSQVVISPNMDSMFFAIEKMAKKKRGYNNEEYFDLMDSHKFILKYDAFFDYLDYLELQAVKQQSEKSEAHARAAENHALWAIWIAIGMAILSIFSSIALTYWQIKSPVSIDGKQFNKVIGNNESGHIRKCTFNKGYQKFERGCGIELFK